jgi:hypothetical protein
MAKKKVKIAKPAAKKVAPKKIKASLVQPIPEKTKPAPKKAPEITQADLGAVQTLLDRARAELVAERRGAPRRKLTKRPLSISGIGR